MRKLATLLYREWLEHRSIYIAAPAVVVAVLWMVLLIGHTSATYMIGQVEDEVSTQVQISGEDIESLAELKDWLSPTNIVINLLDVAGSTDDELHIKIEFVRTAAAQPFYVILLIITFFALAGSLFEDRRDRTVLFWKSLPVSDTQTVLSKAIFFAWVGPLVVVGFIWIMQLSMVAYAALNVEDGMAGRVWSQSGLLTGALELLAGYLIYGLWVLPLVAWVLVVSSAVKKLPILWLLVVPWVFTFVESIFFHSGHLGLGIARHLSPAPLPHAMEPIPGSVLAAQFDVLLSSKMWVGLAVSGVLLAAAIWLRKRHNEI